MNAPTPPPDPRDELVSAVLDGVATEAERATVAADPELRQRLDEMRVVRDLVAEPVAPLDEVTARRLRERALAEVLTTPIDGDAAPTRRRPPMTWLVGAAAAVLLLLLAVPLLGQLSGGDDDASDQLATAGDSDEAADSSGDTAADAGAAEMSAEESSSDDAAAPESDGLLVVATDRELADAALDAHALLVTRSSARPEAIDNTEEGADGDAGGESEDDAATTALRLSTRCPADREAIVVGVQAGTVDGELRLVRIEEQADGTRMAVVVDPTDCTVVLRAR